MKHALEDSVGATQIGSFKITESQQRHVELDVLIIDDDEESANSIARLVFLWGHRVRIAMSSAAVLQEIKKSPPDVVIVDAGLPEMDGNEIRRTANRSQRKRPFLIALSDLGQEEGRRRAKDAGIDFLLIKPTDIDLLQWVLGRFQSVIF